ncbi:MAG TPA: nitronate monooxygenase [Kineosporiaceae bacterium]
MTGLRTALTEALGIRYPIVQTGMGYVAGAGLAAATSAAGGLGVIASATMSLAELRVAVAEVKRRTDAPFGVNLRTDAADARERVDLIIAEGVRVASFAQAPDRDLIQRLRDAGVFTMPSVGARRHAEKVAAWGVDAVVVQGGEGGGHTGQVPTSLLVPQVVDAVDVPVVAAGGYFDGRGLVSALAYGAAGIAMGTRFLLTSDSPVPDVVKRAYLAASVTDTVVTRRVDGVPHRVLRTPTIAALESAGPVATVVRAARHAVGYRRLTGTPWRTLLTDGRAMRRDRGLSWAQVLQAANTPMMLRAAMVDGRTAYGVMASGQVAGLIEDLPSCAELIDRVVVQALEVIEQLDRTRQQ